MAKTATFKAKEVLGQDYTVLDSMENIKKIDKNMKDLYHVLDKLDNGKDTTLMDYNEAINNQVIAGVANLLKLSKEDTEKLNGMSYSEIFNFYHEAVDKFTGMEVPSVRGMQARLAQAAQEQPTDPKQNSAK